MLNCCVAMSSVILVTIFLMSLNFAASQRCMERIYVPRTRLKAVPSIENYWTENWLGFHVQKTRQRVNFVKEHFTETRFESVCCPGYTQRFSQCEPMCTRACPENSRCTAPDVCTCNFGYSSIGSDPSSIVCEPRCPAGCPANSSCTSPYKCTCDKGYKVRIGGGCEPICSSLCPAHSSCTAPDQCTCEPGYNRTADGRECVPECKNGCPLNMYCKAPDVCACRFGYTPRQTTPTMESAEPTTAEQSKSGAGDECVPICSEGCPAQSKCVAPEECRCEQGYTMLSENDDAEFDGGNEALPLTNSRLCVPICEQPCPLHASCMRPNQCECAPGFELHQPPQHHAYCRAQCAQNCSVNGKCVAPNVCECFDGYGHVNGTSDGASANAPYCQPKCRDGCPHGICFAPGICVCQPGYLMGAAGVCEPICTKNCQHGHCVEPEICACDKGYQLSTHDYSQCEPICNTTCINADCAAPNICLCKDKYKPKIQVNNGVLSVHECEPMCTPECIHADCVAPDQCRCHDGYAPHTNATHMCVPNCGGSCVSGSCTAPGRCECAEGFEPSSSAEVTECLPITTSASTAADATTAHAFTADVVSTTTTSTSYIWSTTSSTEWFTAGLVAEALTTITDEHNVAALLPREHNLDKCNDLCYCWKALDDDSGKLCWEICDLHNETCLDAKFLHCNETAQLLEYNKQGESIKSFVCGVNRTSTNHYRGEIDKAEPTWLLILGSALILVLTVAIVYLCVRIYQSRHQTGAHEISIRLLMRT